MRNHLLSILLVGALSGAAYGPATAGLVQSLRANSVPKLAQSAGTERKILDFRGMRVRIGSAAVKTQALLRAHPNFTLPNNPLFVADPALNAIVIFNANGSGTQLPSAVLAGPNTQLNGPDSVVGGWNLPCSPAYTSADCQHYLFVVNAGNNSVNVYKYPLLSANQAPSVTFTAPSSCSVPGLGFPAGIVNVHPTNAHASGYLAISDEHAATNGAIEMYNIPSVSGPNCPFVDDTNPPDTRLDSSSGLSYYGQPSNARVFNANATTVTEERLRLMLTFLPGQTWAVGGPAPASTQGTAFDSGEPNGGDIWVTAAHGMTAWPDGVWLCSLSAFTSGTCSNSGPTITAGLSFPVFPKAFQSNHRLYVPNNGNGTVTSYPEAGPYAAPYATYTNLASPWDVAGLDD